jgi:hypothetical protein
MLQTFDEPAATMGKVATSDWIGTAEERPPHATADTVIYADFPFGDNLPASISRHAQVLRGEASKSIAINIHAYTFASRHLHEI